MSESSEPEELAAGNGKPEQKDPLPSDAAASSASKKKSKKKKKGANKEGAAAATGGAGPAAAPAGGATEAPAEAPPPSATGLSASVNQRDLVQALVSNLLSEEKKKERRKEDHKFWSTQPVLDYGDAAEEQGEIETKTVDEVQVEPYNLPQGFAWCDCDLTDDKILDEVYELLYNNYVEDDDHVFRFDYSRDFLRWALHPPDYKPQFHIGVRVMKSQKLVGFITGIPALMSVYDRKLPMVEINFLCVLKKLRSNRLAPVLIKEVTRRVNLTNVWQAVYTAGVVLPKPVAQNRYWHRSLNPKKLVDIGFSRVAANMTMARTIKLYKLPAEVSDSRWRPAEKKDMPQVHRLLREYLKKFKLHPMFETLQEVEHWLLPRPGVVHSFVMANPDGKVTDFVSFYVLCSSISGNPRYTTLRAAYSFYNASTVTPWRQLMLNALIEAKRLDFDVFNALDVMDNMEFIKELKFGIGDGSLQYYIYNWRCARMDPSDVGLVLM